MSDKLSTAAIEECINNLSGLPYKLYADDARDELSELLAEVERLENVASEYDVLRIDKNGKCEYMKLKKEKEAADEKK